MGTDAILEAVTAACRDALEGFVGDPVSPETVRAISDEIQLVLRTLAEGSGQGVTQDMVTSAMQAIRDREEAGDMVRPSVEIRGDYAPAPEPTIRMLDESVLSRLLEPGAEDEAVTAINEYTRARLREDGFLRRLLPPVPATDFDRQVDTDVPVRVVDPRDDEEPRRSRPWARRSLMFDRIVTPRFTREAAEQLDRAPDLRDILARNALRDMQMEVLPAEIREQTLRTGWVAYETIGQAVINTAAIDRANIVGSEVSLFGKEWLNKVVW